MTKTKKLIKKFNEDLPRFEKNIARLVKKGKNKPIKEEIFHKVMVGDRRREIELAKLDNLMVVEYGNGVKAFIPLDNPIIQGEFAKRKELKAKYRRMCWKAVGIFLVLPIVYILTILIVDIFYGRI